MADRVLDFLVFLLSSFGLLILVGGSLLVCMIYQPHPMFTFGIVSVGAIGTVWGLWKLLPQVLGRPNHANQFKRQGVARNKPNPAEPAANPPAGNPIPSQPTLPDGVFRHPGVRLIVSGVAVVVLGSLAGFVGGTLTGTGSGSTTCQQGNRAIAQTLGGQPKPTDTGKSLTRPLKPDSVGRFGRVMTICNLREGPSQTTKRKGETKPGEFIKILRVKTDEQNEEWVQVRFPERPKQPVAWVHRFFVKVL